MPDLTSTQTRFPRQRNSVLHPQLVVFRPLRYDYLTKNMTIDLQPRLLEWARHRARFTEEELAVKMGVTVEKVAEWETEGRLTLTQAEKLAKVTHTPFGYLFLPEPPDEKLPIPDLPDAESAKLWALEEQAEESAERLQEYRKTLSAKAVTGKIDVRRAP